MIPNIKFTKSSVNTKHKIVFVDDLKLLKSRAKDSIQQRIEDKIEENYVQLTFWDQAQEQTWVCLLAKKKERTTAWYEKVRQCAAKVSIEEESELQILSKDNSAIIAFIEGLILSNYSFSKISNKKENKSHKLIIDSALKELITPTLKVLEEVTWARDLINLPLSHLTAEVLAEKIKERGASCNVSVDVFHKKKIESLKMGGLLAVNKGSIDPPTFTVAEYKPKKAINKKPIILVGKGVVYDTGGMSLKPTPNSMDMMKSDMGGASCMAASIMAVAKLELPLHVIALIPATDNRPGQNAYVPGDVIQMYDGTTVEVLNTDAEGRMILADALAYAKKYDPELVIDAATLTGAAVRAIGQNAVVAMGNAEEKYFKLLDDSGYEMHERIARMPFWDDYKEDLKSDVADLNNLAGPYAGQITAGKFLEHFTDYPYIHLDIAGPTFLSGKKGYLPKGGTGYGVRLLAKFMEKRAEENE